MSERHHNITRSDDKNWLEHYTVDSYAGGISFGQHKTDSELDHTQSLILRIQDNTQATRIRSRYAVNKTEPLVQLEKYLMKLSSQGKLHRAHIYFGTSTDPFHPFEGKFDASIKFLELFRRYTPGHLTVQTRSPLIVIALPVFSALGKHVSINMGVETCDEQAVRRYTPNLPRIEERLKTARALRRFGINVNFQVAPLLPYGDWKKDARAMAEVLVENADYINILPMNDGSYEAQKNLRQCPIAKKLAEDRKFEWLRSNSAQALIDEISSLDQKKLLLPEFPHLKDPQLKIFAA